jgi:hypothetical protein
MRTVKRVSQQDNAQAAMVILADPRRYDGLPLAWAELWMKHALERKQKAIGPAPKSPQAVAARR